MILLYDNNNIQLEKKTIIALGSFDGLHLGHLSLIRKTIELANKHNCQSMVYTFENHPMTVISKEKVPKLIQTNNEKIELLKEQGLDLLRFEEFNLQCMNTECEDFILNLINKYNAIGIVVGFNYRFGKNNKGDINLLKTLSTKHNFKLTVCPPFSVDNIVVSSTYIREIITAGKVENVKKYLGRYFSLQGIVIHGKKLGTKLGFSTANLQLDTKYLLPKAGVYFTFVEYKEKYFKAITNIGYNPTVNGKNLTVETHLLDFNDDLYGETLKIYFIERMRDEKKFDNIELLKETLAADKDNANKKNIIFKK